MNKYEEYRNNGGFYELPVEIFNELYAENQAHKDKEDVYKKMWEDTKRQLNEYPLLVIGLKEIELQEQKHNIDGSDE